MRDVDSNAEVVLRRFGAEQLSGRDLTMIRTAVLDITQDELARQWGVSRTLVSRWESGDEPDQRVCDGYRGLLMRKIFFKNFKPTHVNDSFPAEDRCGEQSLQRSVSSEELSAERTSECDG